MEMFWTNDHREWYNEVYLNSEHWAGLKSEKLKEANFKCERCPNRTCLEVHHKNYKNLFDVELSDLEVLCRKCHGEEHELNGLPRRVKPSFDKLPESVKIKIRRQFLANPKSRIRLRQVPIRLSVIRKKAYSWAAQQAGMPLAKWAIHQCDEHAIKYARNIKAIPLVESDGTEGEYVLSLWLSGGRKFAWVYAAKQNPLLTWVISVLDKSVLDAKLNREM